MTPKRGSVLYMTVIVSVAAALLALNAWLLWIDPSLGARYLETWARMPMMH